MVGRWRCACPVFVLTFDCYGTLIDWESGMVAALAPLVAKVGAPLSRNAVLEAHARHESSQQRHTPTKRYSELLADRLQAPGRGMGRAGGLGRNARAMGRSVGDWPAFPDTVAALQVLKRHYKLVILSNVDNESFALSNRRLGVTFDAIYTAEDIGSYKPGGREFRLHAGGTGLARRAARATSSTQPKAYSTIMCRRRNSAWRRPGSTAATGRPDGARRPRRRGALRFPLHEPRRDGGGAPQRSGRARLRPCSAGRPRGGPRSNSLACGRPCSAKAGRARSGGCCR